MKMRAVHNLVAVCAFLAGTSGWGQGLDTDPRCSPSCDDLRSRANSQGKVDVDIYLKLSVSIGESREAAISRTQGEFLAGLTAYQVTVQHIFQRIPSIALLVDGPALEVILNNPKVRSISENQSLRLHLFGSGPLIHAPEMWNLGFTGNGYAIAVRSRLSSMQLATPTLPGKALDLDPEHTTRQPSNTTQTAISSGCHSI